MNKLKKRLIITTGAVLCGITSIYCINRDKLLPIFQPTKQVECIEQENFTQISPEQQGTPKIENDVTEQETPKTEDNTKKQETPKTKDNTKEQEKPKEESNAKNKEAPKKKAVIKKTQEKKAEIVYITETGECYHRNGCKHLRRSKIAIDKKNAVTKYRPCKDCMPQ